MCDVGRTSGGGFCLAEKYCEAQLAVCSLGGLSLSRPAADRFVGGVGFYTGKVCNATQTNYGPVSVDAVP